MTIGDAAAAQHHAMEHRIALGVVRFHIGAMGNRGDEMRAKDRLAVMSHLDAEGLRHARDAQPHGRAAAPARVEIADVDGAFEDEIATGLRGHFRLTRGDRHAGRRAQARHVALVVVPVARLLEPA